MSTTLSPMRPTPTAIRTQVTQRLTSKPSPRFEGDKSEAPTAAPKKSGQFIKRFMIASALGLNAGMNIKTHLWGAGVGILIAGALALSRTIAFTPIVIPAVMGVFSTLGGLAGFVTGWQLDPERATEEAQKGWQHLSAYITEQLSRKKQSPAAEA